MAFGLGKIKSVENAFCIWIPDGRTLSRHVWEKYQSVAAGRNFFRDFIQLIQGRNSRLLLHHPFIIRKLPFKPPHDASASGGSALKKPQTGNHMESQDQPGIRFVFFRTDTHSARLAALLLGFSRMDHACSQRSAGGVKTSCRHRCPLRETGFPGRFLCHRTHDLVAASDLRKKFPANTKTAAHFFIPHAFSHIKAMQSVTLRQILCHLSCQFKSNITIRLKNLICIFVNFRKILLIPEDLRRCIGRLERIARCPENLFRTDLFIQPIANILRPGIHPDWRVGKNVSLAVNGNGGPALSVNSYPCDLFRQDTRALDAPPHRAAHGFPPFLRVLFRPAFMGIINRIIAVLRRQNSARPVENGNFTCACSDINTQ